MLPRQLLSQSRRAFVRILSVGLGALLSVGCATSTVSHTPQTVPATMIDQTSPDYWQQSGREALAAALAQRNLTGKARGIVLFLGDGMGVSTVTAGRIFAGQQLGKPGEDHSLSFEWFPNLSLIKTYNVNQQTPDSAGTMSAIMTGVKTDAGLISVDATVRRGDCAGSDGKSLVTLLEQLEERGWSTGVVSTARLTHATPGAAYAHSPERGWEDDAAIPEEERRKGCKDIAAQLIDMPFGDGLEVALGGGRRHFLPRERDGVAFYDPEETGMTGQRLDGRHLGEEWQSRPRARWVWNQQQFDAVDPDEIDHLLGTFNYSHMQFELDRENDRSGEPSLSEMTAKALQLLQRNDKGFLLIVEAGRIDHAHHAANAKRALVDTAELSRAVAVADEMTADEDTLILVTADHSHVMTIAGYATRGHPILGLSKGNDAAGEPNDEVVLAADALPYTTIGYANGPGSLSGASSDYFDDQKAGGSELPERRLDLTGVDTEADAFIQDALVPLQAETHAGEDVALYAKGPWAHLLRGTQEQSYIYYVMRHAACGDCRSEASQ